jgi:sigma-B regulation protein RsbU (phosphoserine phosphatase)
MSQSLNGNLGTQTAVEVPAYPAKRTVSGKARRLELENKLELLQKDYAELHTAIFEAAQVHRRLCAPRLVRYDQIEIASEIFAVRQLPGDFFTIEETSDEATLALGDICGKGLAAGMWTTHVVGLVRAHTTSTSQPEEIVSGVNRDICRAAPIPPLASLFLGKLNPMTGVMNYCSAGHPPAFLLRAGGKLEALAEGGMLLGVLAEANYVRGQCELRVGDMLIIYSDGITESQNKDGEEFGYARLEAQLRSAQLGSADAALFSVLGAVQDFAGTRPLVDDMSVAVIRHVG